ncbi:MAG: hypothetical protein ASARMPRED_005940 [Alectoria sarmentosa]|nr:MAG: hypothetical protein ASARMPRED_005940 [Alectoria sarmentosa]
MTFTPEDPVDFKTHLHKHLQLKPIGRSCHRLRDTLYCNDNLHDRQDDRHECGDGGEEGKVLRGAASHIYTVYFMEILRVDERFLTEGDLSLSRRVFRHQIGLFAIAKTTGNRMMLHNNGAVDKAIWQRLDIDGSVKSDEVELRDLGWNTFAKKHLLVTKGIDVRIAAEPQVTMNVVQYGHEKSDIMSPFGYVIHCRWFSLRVEMALDMKSW